MSDAKCSDCGSVYNVEEYVDCPTCARSTKGPESASELDLARDPATDPDVLGKLAFSSNRLVVDAVIVNPSTPAWAVRRFGGTPAAGAPATGKQQREPAWRGPIQLTTNPTVPGAEIVANLGLVYSARSHTKWKAASQKDRLQVAMQGAVERIRESASDLGAHAVVGIVFAANSSSGNGSGFDVGSSDGIVLMGTAVKLAPVGQQNTPSSEPMKLCPVCQETVYAHARKCRYCLEWFPDDEQQQ